MTYIKNEYGHRSYDCIGDFIPENDPVRVLDAIVEHLDISAIEATSLSSYIFGESVSANV